MTEDQLYQDAALARFYDIDNEWTEDREFCLGMAGGYRTVLDLGCGTGDLAIRMAAEQGAEVTAVDPARPMLDLARAKPGAGAVRWLPGDARSLDLEARFDLITMTGHAFQTLLTPSDRAACLATIARHLAPDGRFVLDSRNPAGAEWQDWRPAPSHRVLDDPLFGRVEAWNDARHDPATGIVTYETFYRLTDGRRFHAASRIAFPTIETLASEIAAAGLEVERWLGDWAGGPLGPDSPEFIPIGRRAAT